MASEMRPALLSAAREHTGDPQTDAIWRELRAIAAILTKAPLVNGQLITEELGPNVVKGSGVAFSSGVARSIPHRLGRRAQGFFEMYAADVPSAGHVGLRATEYPTGITSATHIRVTPAATGTCWIWVF